MLRAIRWKPLKTAGRNLFSPFNLCCRVVRWKIMSLFNFCLSSPFLCIFCLRRWPGSCPCTPWSASLGNQNPWLPTVRTKKIREAPEILVLHCLNRNALHAPLITGRYGTICNDSHNFICVIFCLPASDRSNLSQIKCCVVWYHPKS